MKTVIKLSGVLFLIGLILFACSCSKPHYGCKKREVRYVQKHFPKLVNKCNSETIRQSLIYYPLVESDSVFSETETKVDTFTHYDTLVENDTVYITKYVDRIVNKVTTNTKEVRVEDGRRVGLLENDISILNKRLAQAIEDKIIAEKGKAKSDGKLLVFYWAIGVVIGIVGIRFAVKNFKPKMPFFG